MAKKKFDEQLAAIEALANVPAGPEAEAALRKALSNQNNYIVAKAAAVAARGGSAALAPELLAALERFYVHPARTDPQCWAKKALIQALADLGHSDAAAYLRGLRHVQMEAVWGGRTDTAGPLRALCASAVVNCTNLNDMETLSYLLEALVDPDKTVRAEAARAIGRVGRAEGALLLRLRSLTGDEEPEATGACFSGVLAIDGQAGIEFVSRFLSTEGPVAEEAALALGATHDVRAFEALRARWDAARDATLTSALLTAMALSRLPEALDFLTGLIAGGSHEAAEAIRALASLRISEEERTRLREAVERSGNPRLEELLAQAHGR